MFHIKVFSLMNPAHTSSCVVLPVILSLGTSILEQMHVPRNRALLEKNGIKKYRAARNKIDIQKSIALPAKKREI